MSDEPPERRRRRAGPAEPHQTSVLRSRELWRVVYRDPEHVAERLTLYTAGRLGDPSREWARSVRSARPDTPRGQDRRGAAYAVGACRADRWCDLRNAVLHRARPRLPHVSAAGDADDAAHRRAVRPRPGGPAHLGGDARAARRAPGRRDRGGRAEFGPRQGDSPIVPTQRRSWRTWVHSVYLLLIFGGFMSPSVAKEDTGTRGKVRAVFGVALGRGDLGDDLGAPPDLHDRDGLGL